MFHTVRKMNRKNLSNYIEIYIESDVKKIISKGKKKIYKEKKNLVGRDIKAEFPKKPDIKIKNNFDKTINQISIELFNKIRRIKK